VLATLAKDDSTDFPFMPIERADLLAGLSIPYLHGAIALSRDQVAAVGAERHALVWQCDFSLCGRQPEDFTFGPRVPGPNGIDAARGERSAFGVPGQEEGSTPDAADLLGAADLGAPPAGLPVPDLDEPVVARRNNPLDGGAERDTADFITVLAEGQG